MRFNFVSETSDGMGLAARVIDEGNEARLWIRTKDAAAVGDGIVPKVGDLEDMVRDADPQRDVFVFDTSSNGLLADYLRSKGLPVIGGSTAADRLERDRAFGSSAMTENGIKIPKTKTFYSFADATKYVQAHKDMRLVYKPSKLLGELSCSHVTADSEELLELLALTDSETKIENPEFDLQEFTPGVPLSTEMWFDGEDFIEGMWNHTLERKELMDGNLGPSGGCTGNIVWACGECPVCKACRKMASFLKEQHYVGMLDLNAIVTDAGEIRGLEWTPRFGYDASPTLLWECLDGEIGNLFSDIARHQYGDVSPKLRENYGGAVRITIPPWPTERHLASEGLPIRGLTKKDADNVYLYNVKSVGGKLYTAGAWGILLLLTGSGSNISGALRVPYDMAERVRVSDKQYRLDLVGQFKDDLRKLEAVLD
jgi:phosphoribosylamine---glycine ligase